MYVCMYVCMCECISFPHTKKQNKKRKYHRAHASATPPRAHARARCHRDGDGTQASGKSSQKSVPECIPHTEPVQRVFLRICTYVPAPKRGRPGALGSKKTIRICQCPSIFRVQHAIVIASRVLFRMCARLLSSSLPLFLSSSLSPMISPSLSLSQLL